MGSTIYRPAGVINDLNYYKNEQSKIESYKKLYLMFDYGTNEIRINQKYSNLKEVVSNAALECKIKCVDRNNHVYRFEIVAPSKKLSEKIVKFVFLTCQKSLEDRRAIVFQKNAGRIEDMQKREGLRKLINKDSLKIEILGDVRIRKIW